MPRCSRRTPPLAYCHTATSESTPKSAASFARVTKPIYYPRVSWPLRLLAGLVGGCLTIAPLRAQDPVTEQFLAGLELHQQAERAANAEEARTLLQRALQQYTAAAERDPQHYPSLAMWAVVETQLAELEPAGSARREAVERARQRVLLAERAPRSDGRATVHWARFLLQRESRTDRKLAEMGELLAECRTELQKVIRKTPMQEIKTDAQMLLGETAVRLALLKTDPTIARQLIEEALSVLAEAAMERPTDAGIPFVTGLALLHRGQLDRDPLAYVEAVKSFENAVGLSTNDCVMRLGLARALALCGRPLAAFERLQPCLDHPQALEVWSQIDQLPEFAAMRALPDYHTATRTIRQRLQRQRGSQLLQSAMKLHREAESLTNDLTRASNLLREAIAQYESASELLPDVAQPRFLAGVATIQMLDATRDLEEQARLAAAARDKLEAAARCHDADLKVLEHLGVFLQRLAWQPITTAEQRPDLLRRAREAFTRALEMARFTGERTRLARSLASVCVHLAEQSPPADRRGLYQEAVAHYESTRKTAAIDYTVDELNLWGIALLRLGHTQRDSHMLRRAAERFQTALDKAGERLDIRYNLACSYALLRQPEAAMRHLRQCLEQDTNGTYRAHVLMDSDFDPIRQSAPYRELFGGPGLQKLIEPRISGR